MARTWGKGISKYSPAKAKFRNSVALESAMGLLSSKFILSIFEDSQKRLWIGIHGGGLNKYDPATQRVKVFKHARADASSIIKNIYKRLCVHSRALAVRVALDRGLV